MNRQQTKEEIADIYIQRIIEQNKQEYLQAYESGKKSIYLTLAHRDANIYRLQEIIRNNKLKEAKQEPNGILLKTPYSEKWTWLSKIIYVLLEKNAPMRSQEMIAYFITVDEQIRSSRDMVGYFSAFLTKAVKNNRVVKTKVKGIKGYFYSLPEWMVNGELSPSYYRKMNLFVNQ